MRVRMSYSLEMSEIPTEVAAMLQKRVKELHEALDLVEDACDRLQDTDASIESSVRAIDKARQKLSTFDLTLADMHGILSGFVEAKEQLENPPPPTPEPPGDLDV